MIGLATAPLLQLNTNRSFLSLGFLFIFCEIQLFIEKNRINKSDKINSELLKKLKIINKNSKKLKILGAGEIKEKITIEADLFSKSAKEKLEKIGGSIQIKK